MALNIFSDEKRRYICCEVEFEFADQSPCNVIERTIFIVKTIVDPRIYEFITSICELRVSCQSLFLKFEFSGDHVEAVRQERKLTKVFEFSMILINIIFYILATVNSKYKLSATNDWEERFREFINYPEKYLID